MRVAPICKAQSKDVDYSCLHVSPWSDIAEADGHVDDRCSRIRYSSCLNGANIAQKADATTGDRKIQSY